MDNFSLIHWIITAALVVALGAFLYFVGSLLWAGAKALGKGRLLAAAVLLPLAVLAIVGFLGMNDSAQKAQSPEQGPWLEYQKGR